MNKKEKRILEFIKNNNIENPIYNLDNEEDIIYKQLYNKIGLNYDGLLKSYLLESQTKGFPYPTYNNLNKDLSHLYNTNNIDNAGMRIVKNFHKSIWYANRYKHLSPYDAWYDLEIMGKCIKNRFIYKGFNLSLDNIRYGLTTSKLAPKVSVFKPSLAKYLIKKYLNEFGTIFDPCSGYSGRLLGAYVLGKKYIGQDINQTVINESNELIKYFDIKNVMLKNKNSLNTSGEYECLFTCSPYANKENWGQSIEELTCDEWIEICLNNYKCKSYLFIVDGTTKFKQYIVEEITNKSNFGTNKEYVVMIKGSL